MSATEILCTDLKETQQDAGELQGYVASVDDNLNSAISVLEDVKEISDDLSKLDNGLGTVSLVMTPMRLLPYVGSAVGTIKTGVDQLEKGVHPVRQKANELEKKVKPVREKLEEIEIKVAAAKGRLGQLKEKAAQFEKTLSTTYACLQKKSAISFVKAEDKFCKEVDPSVVALNKALSVAVRIAKGIDKKLQKIEDACKALSDIKKPMKEVDKIVDQISKALKPVEDVLKQLIEGNIVEQKGELYSTLTK